MNPCYKPGHTISCSRSYPLLSIHYTSTSSVQSARLVYIIQMPLNSRVAAQPAAPQNIGPYAQQISLHAPGHLQTKRCVLRSDCAHPCREKVWSQTNQRIYAKDEWWIHGGVQDMHTAASAPTMLQCCVCIVPHPAGFPGRVQACTSPRHVL